MTPQIICEPQKIGISTTQDNSKSLCLLGEGNSSVVIVRVTRKWEDLDFMSTDDITSIDYVIGDELYVVIPKNLIWKFDKKIQEGCLYSIDKLHLATTKSKYHPAYNEKKRIFFVGIPHFLKTISNVHNGQRLGGQPSRMQKITVENVRGSTLKITLWGSVANQVGNEPIDCDFVPCHVLVAVYSTFVKNYQASSFIFLTYDLNEYFREITLSSTNATKVYCNIDLPEIKVLPNISFSEHENRKNISQLLISANVIFCTATATYVLMDRGWHYLACPRCNKKVLGEDDELWCTKYKGKVEMPIAR
ncbi:hypothetical protein MKX01_035105 [Papaver californicum]|nr:hypothetical protein MKX01_035105 [Papaver californicum]